MSAYERYQEDSWFNLAWVRTGETADHEPPYNPKNPINSDPVVWVWDNRWKEWRLYTWLNGKTVGESLPEPECWPVYEKTEEHRVFRRWHIVLGVVIVVLAFLVMAFRSNVLGSLTNQQPSQSSASLDVPVPQATDSPSDQMYLTQCGQDMSSVPAETYVADDGSTHFHMDWDDQNPWIPQPGVSYCITDPSNVYGLFTSDASVAELGSFNIATASSFPKAGESALNGTLLFKATTMWASRYRNSVRDSNPTMYLKRWNEAYYQTWLSWVRMYEVNPTDPALYVITMPGDAPVDLVDQARLLQGEPLPVPTARPRTPTPFQPQDRTETSMGTPGTVPNVTAVVQTPYVAPTATPETIATAQAGGVTQLPAISVDDLIIKSQAGMAIWNLPGIDSVEIRRWSDGMNDWFIGWAPSFTNPQYSFFMTDMTSLGSSAYSAGCSGFNYTDMGAFIYEQRVSMQMMFAYVDQAGINYYTFPAGQTTAGYCIKWPTPTPRPTLQFTPTPYPTNGPTATATDWLNQDNCNISFSWLELINNPTLVTGSGNTFLIKHNMQDPLNLAYVGDITGYTVVYCITGRPSTIGGQPWNGHIISFFGSMYNGYREVNIQGTIWVSEVGQ